MNIPNSRGTAAASLREIAGARLAGDPVKQAIDRAARIAGLSYWRAYDIWYGKARRIEDFEERQILEALEKRRKLVARNEISDLRTRLAALEARLLSEDEEFHSENIGAIRNGLRMAR